MILYRYTGRGWLPGIPARDLDEADMAQLATDQRIAVTTSGLYEPVPGPGPDRHQTELQDELDLSSSSPQEEN